MSNPSQIHQDFKARSIACTRKHLATIGLPLDAVCVFGPYKPVWTDCIYIYRSYSDQSNYYTVNHYGDQECSTSFVSKPIPKASDAGIAISGLLTALKGEENK